MKEKFSDLIYATRTLCEALRDRSDSLEEELVELLEETEGYLEKFSTEEEDDDLD